MFHYEYGASSAKRWTSCLASVRINALCPPGQDSEWGEEGTVAHDVASFCLATNNPKAVPGVGVGYASDVRVTAEMTRSINIYLDYVFDILRKYPGAILRVENQVQVPSSIVPHRMGGTYDSRIYIPYLTWLIVLDYKHGAGIFVDEEDNLQMGMYDVGSLFEMDEPVTRLTNVIIQPRSFLARGAIREAHVDVPYVLKLHAWFEERARLTLDDNAPFEPTPDNCRWCPAAGYGTCPVANKTALAVINPELTHIREIGTKGLPDPKNMSIEQMAYMMANEKLVMALFKNVRMTATGIVRHGGDFPGWKMVLGDAEREWYGKSEDIAAALMALLGMTVDEIMPRQLITLTEAENRLVDMFRSSVVPGTGETKKAHKLRQNEASQLARETLALYTLKQPRGVPRLVPLSDPRPALETSAPLFAGQINLEGLTNASPP